MPENSTEETNGLHYFIGLVIKHIKVLIVLYLVVGITSVTILMIIPKWYKSSATVVILEDNNSQLSGMLSQFSAFGLGNLGGGINVETYIEYAQTKKMYNRLIEEFDLSTIYETETKEDTYDKIFESISIADNENQTFTVSYIFKEDPILARDIVEFILIELDKISLEVDRAQASNFRGYIENYYNQTKARLTADEDSLIAFQRKTGIYELTSQIEATILGIAELEKQKVSLEVERSYLTQSLFDDSRILDLNNRIEAIESQLSNFDNQEFLSLLSLETLPDEGADYLRLFRDIEVGSQVSEFLRLQYEQAILDEQKISSNLYVLDPPQVAEKKYKPRRAQSLFIVMFFTGMVSFFMLGVYDYINKNIHLFMKA